jgi:hypothetical protein
MVKNKLTVKELFAFIEREGGREVTEEEKKTDWYKAAIKKCSCYTGIRSIVKGGQHMTKQPKGLDNRMRDKDGEIRKKRSDTKVGTLRDEYGDEFASGYRSDAKLGTVLKKEGVESLHQLLKKK